MGILIIDGKSVYEVDEECIRKRKIPKECGLLEKLGKTNTSDDPKKSEPKNK